MLATELIARIMAAVKQHGDREVVTGLDRSGYGEEILGIHAIDDAKDIEDEVTPVFDLLVSEESLVSIGGF